VLTLDASDRIGVAADTGPLLSAFQADSQALLHRYFSGIVIVQSQLAEFEKHGAKREIQELISGGFVVVVKNLTDEEKATSRAIAGRIMSSPHSRDPILEHHLPESELMVVAQRVDSNCRRIFLDEKAARSIAEELGLRTSGFLGILANAGLDGLLSKEDIRRLLKICQNKGTHYKENLIELVAQTYGR